MVSSSGPTASSALIVAVNEAGRRMPSRFTWLKPVSVKVTVLSPGRKIGDLEPSSCVAHRAASALDQRATGGFHRHAREHAAGRVTDDAGDAAGALRRYGCGRQSGDTDDNIP